jgi:phosphate acetyltransferase
LLGIFFFQQKTIYTFKSRLKSMADNFLCSTPVVCPPSLLARAKPLALATTAIVNAGSPVVMQSVKLAVDENLITPVLVGDKSNIEAAAKQMSWDISAIRIINAADEDTAAQVAVALARGNEVAALMKGNIHTNNLLKAVINTQLGLRTDTRLSHVFHMSVAGSDATICITDAVINVQPSVAIKLDIARNVTKLMHAIGYQQPKIAVLSATEVATSAIPSSIDAAEVVAAADAGEIEGALVGGPFAFDNAISPAAAKLKKVDHPVAGNADVLLVPNIETGNALFKQMVYFMGAAAAGIVLGAKVPIILTSRADPAAARLAAMALASLYANAS